MKKSGWHVVAIRGLYGQARRFFGWLKYFLVLRGNLRPERDRLMLNKSPLMTLVVSPKKAAFVLTLLVFCLILGYLATQFVWYFTGHDYQLGLAAELDLNGENNIPAWYSSSALLLCAVLLAVIGLAKKRGKDLYSGQWLAMAAIFLYLSMDEAASIHETIGSLIMPALKASGYLGGYLHYPKSRGSLVMIAWVIFGTIAVLIFLLAYLRFLAHLPTKTRNLFLIAGTLYVGGALGVELLAARYYDLYGYQTLTYAMLVICEESFEMLGVVVFIYTLFSYLGSSVTGLRILISNETVKHSPPSAVKINESPDRIHKHG